jgi:hypothetical protein
LESILARVLARIRIIWHCMFHLWICKNHRLFIGEGHWVYFTGITAANISSIGSKQTKKKKPVRLNSSDEVAYYCLPARISACACI